MLATLPLRLRDPANLKGLNVSFAEKKWNLWEVLLGEL